MAVGLLTPLRKETLDNLQLNAGIFLKNFPATSGGEADQIKTVAGLRQAIAARISSGNGILGATRGGGTFTVTREMRTPEIDGMRYRFVGGNFVDSVDAYLSTTLVEMTAQNFIDLLGGTGDPHSAVSGTSDANNIITQKTVIPVSAYLSNLVWVGEIAKGDMVMIELFNAINTADLTMTFADKNEGTLAVEFHACQSNVNDYETAPYRITFLYAPQTSPNG